MASLDQDPDLVLDPLPREEWEQREVYAHFGLAIYFCQCLESGLVTYLALLRVNQLGRRLTNTEHDELFGRLFSRTLGRNLKEVRELFGDDAAALAPDLTNALALRNDLVHHWLRDRALEQGTSARRLAMIDELDAAREQLETVDGLVSERVHQLLEAGGVTRDWVRQEYERLCELASSDSSPAQ